MAEVPIRSDSAIDPDLSRAETIPSSWYFDDAMLDLEYRTVFSRSWQFVGTTEKLAAPGTYFTAKVANEPLIIVRGDDGAIRALSNVCRHRAGPVAAEEGTRRSFQCGYHGWTYSLDGRILTTPEFDEVECFRREEHSLPEFEVDTWGPLVFVRLESGGASLTDTLGDLPERIGHVDLEQFNHARRKDWLIDCNWKVYVDNYLEGYHIPIVHPGLFRELDYANYRTETKERYSIQHSPIRRPERIRTGTATDGEARYFWIFPNLMLNVYPDNYSTNLIVPLSTGRTLTVFEWYFRDPGSPSTRAVVDETVAFSDEIQIEDIGICEAVQAGLRSRTYDRGRYSVRRENGVRHFHGLLAVEIASGHGAR